MTVIACNCGETEVHFSTTKPLFRLICCCNDCNAILHWASWKNGTTFYPAFQGIDKIYMENSLKFVKGEENLRWVKITEASVCLRGVTTCCYSSLFVENLSILGPKIVCIDVDFCKVQGVEACDVTAQIFEKDIPSNRKTAVCEGFKGPRFEEGPEDTSMWPSVIPTILEAQSKEIITPDGFGALRDSIEKSVKSYGWINLKGYNENGDPPIVLA
jgi:hypothetical protein